MGDREFSDTSYRQYLNEDKLMGARCNNCNAIYLPPRPICIKCNSSDLKWEEVEGRGELAAFTAITVGPPFMLEEGFDRNNPYCVGVVKLKEGLRVDARILGVDTKNPDTIKVGTPLKVKYLHRGEGDKMNTFLAFEV